MTPTRCSYGGSEGYDATVLRSLGGCALVSDQWPVLRGSCGHQARVPHQLVSEAVRESIQTKALKGRL
jgi:hypothetical protein